MSAVSRQRFRFRNYRITPDLGPSAEPITYSAQCAVCEETGPEADSSGSACAWIVVHLRAHPEHQRYREHISRPYRADRAEWR